MKVRWREKRQNNSWKMSEIHFLRFVFWNPWHTLGISLYIPILHLTCERPGFECFENKTSNTLRAEPSKWVYQKSWEGWAFRRKRGFSSSWCCPGTVPTQLFRFFCPHCSLYFCLLNFSVWLEEAPEKSSFTKTSKCTRFDHHQSFIETSLSNVGSSFMDFLAMDETESWTFRVGFMISIKTLLVRINSRRLSFMSGSATRSFLLFW